jgi:GAF domain-containing protein
MGTPARDDVAEIVAGTFTAVEILARALRVKDAKLQPTLDAILGHAAAAHPAAHDAGVILLIGGKLVPQAALGRAPQVLDLKQQETGEGPCVDAARTQALIRVNDTKTDSRWPEFSAEAQACDVRSLLCAPLWVSDQRLGALTLYSQQPDIFSDQDTKLIELFAALAALALAEAQRTEQLREAIASRDLIGQAKGMLMERYQIDGDAAFAVLGRTSQNLNLKLTAVARHLADTGELLGPPEGMDDNHP